MMQDKVNFKQLREHHNIVDTYRYFHENKNIYTYKNDQGATRNDRIYDTKDLISLITTSIIFQPLIQITEYLQQLP